MGNNQSSVWWSDLQSAMVKGIQQISDEATFKIGLFGAVNTGKSKLYNVLLQFDATNPNRARPGHVESEAQPLSYHLGPKLVLVDFPGVGGRGFFSAHELWTKYRKEIEECALAVLVWGGHGCATETELLKNLLTCNRIIRIFLVKSKADEILKNFLEAQPNGTEEELFESLRDDINKMIQSRTTARDLDKNKVHKLSSIYVVSSVRPDFPDTTKLRADLLAMVPECMRAEAHETLILVRNEVLLSKRRHLEGIIIKMCLCGAACSAIPVASIVAAPIYQAKVIARFRDIVTGVFQLNVTTTDTAKQTTAGIVSSLFAPFVAPSEALFDAVVDGGLSPAVAISRQGSLLNCVSFSATGIACVITASIAAATLATALRAILDEAYKTACDNADSLSNRLLSVEPRFSRLIKFFGGSSNDVGERIDRFVDGVVGSEAPDRLENMKTLLRDFLQNRGALAEIINHDLLPLAKDLVDEYIREQIYRKIFSNERDPKDWLPAQDRETNDNINRKFVMIRKYHGEHPSTTLFNALEVPSRAQNLDWSVSIQGLEKFCDPVASSPMDKLSKDLCGAMASICRILAEPEDDGTFSWVGADAFIPGLLYALSMSRCEDIWLQITLLKAILSPENTSANQTGYFFTALEAVLGFIQRADPVYMRETPREQSTADAN